MRLIQWCIGALACMGQALLVDNSDPKDPSRCFEGETLLFRRSADHGPLPPEPQVTMASSQAVVTLVYGDGEVVRANGTKEVLSANMFLAPGDFVSAQAGSKVELIVGKQNVVRLHGPTRLSLVADPSSVSRESRPRPQLRSFTGGIWAKVANRAWSLVHFELPLPNALSGVHG